MLYTVQFLVDVPSQAVGLAARSAAQEAITGAGGTIRGTNVARRQATYQIAGVVCDTGERWTWKGEADDAEAAEAAALAGRPASSKVAVVREV